jgi:hypothetical protein
MVMLAVQRLRSTHLHFVDKDRQRLGYETQARHWGEIESGLENVEDWSSSAKRKVDSFTWTMARDHGDSKTGERS